MAYKQSYKKTSSAKKAPKSSNAHGNTASALERDLKKCEEYLKEMERSIEARKADVNNIMFSALMTFPSQLQDLGVHLTKVRLSNSMGLFLEPFKPMATLGELVVGMDQEGRLYRGLGRIYQVSGSHPTNLGISYFRDEPSGLISQYIDSWKPLSQEDAEEIREAGDGFGEWVSPRKAQEGALNSQLEKKYKQLSEALYRIGTSLPQLPVFLDQVGLTARSVVPWKDGITRYLATGHLRSGIFPFWDLDVPGKGTLTCVFEQTPLEDPPGAMSATLSFRTKMKTP